MGQLDEHADAPGGETLPAQHRHASVDRHEVVRVAVLHKLPFTETSSNMLHLSSAPHFDAHTLVGPVRHL